MRLLEEGVTTRAYRCGMVALEPHASVGRHTTGSKEEVIVLLAGIARLTLAGVAPCTLRAPALAYIPPHTIHNVTNRGRRLLRYIYLVHKPARC